MFQFIYLCLYTADSLIPTVAVGDQLLALVPQQESGLRVSFCGSYTVFKKVGDKNYVISSSEGRRMTRLCHVHLLNQYQGHSHEMSVACAVKGQISEDVCVEGETVPTHQDPVLFTGKGIRRLRLMLSQFSYWKTA